MDGAILCGACEMLLAQNLEPRISGMSAFMVNWTTGMASASTGLSRTCQSCTR